MITNCKNKGGILRNTNKRKGFTLIELLAVIVILAIIALIATPIILNMINDAKKSAAKDSAYGYIEAIEYNNSMSAIDSKKYPLIESGEVTTLDVKVKGTPPTKGNVTITSGRVTEADLCINNYSVHYDGKEATIEGNACDGNIEETKKGPTQEVATSDKTYKAIVYLDPTDLTKECNESNSESTTGKKEGCMKWYAYKDDGTNYTMILDHNTTALVAWNSNGNNESGPSLDEGQIMDKLKKDTEGWNGVTTRTDKYEFKSETINYTIDYNGYKARLITADEVAHIVGADKDDTIKWNSSKTYGTDDIETKASWLYLDGTGTTYSSTDGWQKQVANSTTKSKYAWLFDNTYRCTSYGCNIADSSNHGYWTSTPVFGTSTGAWSVYSNSYLNYCTVDNAYGSVSGVRPVITISKSIIS